MNIDDIFNNFAKQINDSAKNTLEEKEETISPQENNVIIPPSFIDILKEVFLVDEEIFNELALEEQNKLTNTNSEDSSSEDSKIITGPDGTKWLVEKSGLWINLDEVENAESIKNSNQYSLDIRTNYVDPLDELSFSAYVAESEEHDSPTLILSVFIPHNSTFVLTSEKNVIDSYVYFGITSPQINTIGDIKIESQYIPTCKFYSSDHSAQVSLNTFPSIYYKFNRPSKLYATCSNELITEGSSGTSTCPRSNNQTSCPSYESDSWATVYGLVSNEDTLFIQKKRYGSGTYRYRLYDNNNSTVIFSDSDESITSKNQGNTYCSFELFQKFVSEWIDEKGYTFEVVEINEEKVDIEMVYTQYVANA